VVAVALRVFLFTEYPRGLSTGDAEFPAVLAHPSQRCFPGPEDVRRRRCACCLGVVRPDGLEKYPVVVTGLLDPARDGQRGVHAGGEHLLEDPERLEQKAVVGHLDDPEVEGGVQAAQGVEVDRFAAGVLFRFEGVAQ